MLIFRPLVELNNNITFLRKLTEYHQIFVASKISCLFGEEIPFVSNKYFVNHEMQADKMSAIVTFVDILYLMSADLFRTIRVEKVILIWRM